MPGYPDNIRASDRGTFLVGINTIRFRGRLPPSFLDLIGPYPAIKRFITKVVPLSWYSMLLPRYGLVLELGQNGEVSGQSARPQRQPDVGSQRRLPAWRPSLPGKHQTALPACHRGGQITLALRGWGWGGGPTCEKMATVLGGGYT
ncbi:hypothetical protein SKAU_G00027540 [Synaphobranchus kaupii]|uniref:Uncharacterized protein n=1 Tax=Synaphobranchus kaupii TaxID=118154 RepID=A0A9Q1GD00_SYNKA|nr:hypothetical protein SKAU_G00027540 [Synaphobranchus kaupii]